MSIAASYHTRFMREYSKTPTWKTYKSQYQKKNLDKLCDRQRRFRQKNKPYIKFKKLFQPSLTVTQIRQLCEAGLIETVAKACVQQQPEALGMLRQVHPQSSFSAA